MAEQPRCYVHPQRRHISTASGIPHCRDTEGQWKRTPSVTYQAFVGKPLTNASNWARRFAGYPRMAKSHPNAAHYALARWQREGLLSTVLTHNVDSLQERAGSRDVFDVHVRIDQGICLHCQTLLPEASCRHVWKDPILVKET